MLNEQENSAIQEYSFPKNTNSASNTEDTHPTLKSNQETDNLNLPKKPSPNLRQPWIFERFTSFLSKDSVTFLLLIILTYLGISFLTDQGYRVASSLFAPLEYGFSPNFTKINGKTKPLNQQIEDFKVEKERRLVDYSKNLKATEIEKTRIVEQIHQIQSRARVHLKVTKFFYIQYYISISMASISAVIATICLLLISKVGWKDAKKPTTNIFIVSASVAILFSTFILMFKQEENIAENKKLFLAYSALEDRVTSYLVTNTFLINLGSSKTEGINKPALVIQHIDSELATLNNIAIGFDATKIPNYQDVYKNMPSTSQP